MKKHILFLAALFCLVGFSYSQSLEDLGDAAFITGKFKEAENYYIQANKLDPSSVLTEKINKSKTFQAEFDIINSAITSKDYSNANAHISKILSLNPGNLWAIEKRAQIGTNQKAAKKQDFVDKIPKGFKGWYYPHSLSKGFSVGLGVWIGGHSLKASYFNYEEYPYTIDYSINYYPADVYLHGIGVGSAYFLSSQWTIDFGLGFLCSFKGFVPQLFTDPETNQPTFINPDTHETELKRYLGGYTRAGVTYRCFRDHLGFSYSWTHGYKKPDFLAPINLHYITVSGYF